ncbi:MAG: RNA polymerase sigma factor [Myxococcota bacterium]
MALFRLRGGRVIIAAGAQGPGRAGSEIVMPRHASNRGEPERMMRGRGSTVGDELDRLEDDALLRRFNAGDAAAFEVLLSRYRKPIYNFLLRSTRSRHQAEDLLQEVFLRVVQRSEQFQGNSKVSTWLFAIARNLCIDASRKAAHRRHPSLDAAAGNPDGPTLGERVPADGLPADREALSRELGARIAHAVDGLPEEQREVFLLRQVQHLPFRDIAAIVDVPENTVKSRMRYALERLQEALAEYEDYVSKLK